MLQKVARAQHTAPSQMLGLEQGRWPAFLVDMVCAQEGWKALGNTHFHLAAREQKVQYTVDLGDL